MPNTSIQILPIYTALQNKSALLKVKTSDCAGNAINKAPRLLLLFFITNLCQWLLTYWPHEKRGVIHTGIKVTHTKNNSTGKWMRQITIQVIFSCPYNLIYRFLLQEHLCKYSQLSASAGYVNMHTSLHCFIQRVLQYVWQHAEYLNRFPSALGLLSLSF